MNNTENVADAQSLKESARKGLNNITTNFFVVAHLLLPLSVLLAVLVILAFCGDIGKVRMDYVAYIPFHEISMAFFLRYAGGASIIVILFMLWKGALFAILGGERKPDIKGAALAGLKFVQFCLLSMIAFGLIGAALVVASVKLSVYIWIAVAVYLVVISVPLYIAEYEYMLTDNNFRKSLCKGIKALKEQWGRVFFRLLVTNAVALLLVVVALMPALALMLGIYDNATAVCVSGAQKPPILVYISECLFMGLGVLAVLCVVYAAVSVKKAFYEEAKVNFALIAEEKREQ